MNSLNVNTLTIVTLGYWAVTALWAGFRGMIRTVLSFLVIILTVIITYAGSPVAYKAMYESANITSYVHKNSAVIVENLTESIASGTDSTGWLDLLPLPAETQAIIEMGDTDMIAQVIRSEPVKQYLTAEIANLIIRITATVFTGLVVFIVLTIIRFILLKMADLPGVSTLDHFFGFVIGLVKGLIVIWIALFIIRLVALTGSGTILMEQIRESEVLSVIDEYNMFRAVIMSLISEL